MLQTPNAMIVTFDPFRVGVLRTWAKRGWPLFQKGSVEQGVFVNVCKRVVRNIMFLVEHCKSLPSRECEVIQAKIYCLIITPSFAKLKLLTSLTI